MSAICAVLLAAGCGDNVPGPEGPGPEPSSEKALVSFVFLAADNPKLSADVTATISGTMITASMPFGTAVSALVATFSTTGTRVSVGGTAQASGMTPNDFAAPVVYRVVAEDGSTQDYTVAVPVRALAQEAYVKASNTGSIDQFGVTVALSADGLTLAVGAPSEFSTATGVGGNQADNSAPGAGAVYVYTRSGTTWAQQAYVKASNTGMFDTFGISVALSSDGSTLAVGAEGESSAATGVAGNQADNSAGDAGAVYVFTRSGTTWTQQAYVKASNTGGNDRFGGSVALSADGSTLAVGAQRESSAATGVGGDQASDAASNAGAVYVFMRSGTTWSQQAYVKASNTAANDRFGEHVALSGDGSVLAVSASGEDSAATGVGGDQASNAAVDAGAVYVLTRSGTTWSQQAYVKASDTGVGDVFGSSVALASDGSTLAVGAFGVATFSGAAYVYTRNGATWSQQASVKGSNTGGGDYFGSAVALSGDGSTLAVGAVGEASAAAGVDGDQADNSALNAGAVYLYTRDRTTWSQRAYVKATNPGEDDGFGSCALSSSGTTLAVGAAGESSAATGIDGNQADNSASSAGALYVFH